VAAVWTDLGRAARTIDAYARGLAEFLEVCEREGVDPVAASRADVAVFVRALTSRPSRHGSNVVSIDSGVGLANATLQQRLVPVRLFFDYLIEEGCASRTRSVGAGIPPVAGSVGSNAVWCRGCRSCRGSRARLSGWCCWPRFAVSRYGIG
jgi:site-specific recombinase XerD